ncbi:MAG: TonB family protein [Bdellovibrionales bacterium]
MRSTLFLTISILVHAICITALAVNHFKSLESPAGTAVEVTMGESAPQEVAESTLNAPNEAIQDQQPSPKPLPKVEEPAQELPKKVVKAKPAPEKKPAKPAKKAPKSEVATVLPKKVKSVESVPAEPENMEPEITEEQAVAVTEPEVTSEPVASEPVNEEKVELIPIEDTPPAGVEAADHNDEIKVEPVDKAAPSDSAQHLNKGGDSKKTAVSYLNLKQFSGNRAPRYPITARRDGRQGQVDLLYRVTPDGRTADIQIAKSSGHEDLDMEAVRAIAKYRFVPGQEGWARHPIIFSLKGVATAMPSRLRSAGATATAE